jgi:hypothetical protein
MSGQREEGERSVPAVRAALVVYRIDLRPVLTRGVNLNDLVRAYRGLPLSDEEGYGIEVPYRMLLPEAASMGSQIIDRREELLIALLKNLEGAQFCEFIDGTEEEVMLGVEPYPGYDEAEFLAKVRSLIADVCDPFITPVQEEGRSVTPEC